tara:strand:+ start:862 stop:1122 length:261 start_codon:yes stop_codon:yes gene_type:complete
MSKISIEGLRLRLNAKSTAKGQWYFDATIENTSDKLTESQNRADVGDITEATLGAALLRVIKDAENTFIADGRTVVGRSDITPEAD